MSWNSFPGAGHHQGGGGGGGYRPPNQYGGPPPPQQGWNNPPPPPQYGYGNGPPPPQQYQGYNNGPPPPPPGNYPGQQYNAPPPTGAPPPSHYQQTGAGYMPPHRQQGNQPPFGAAPIRPPSGQQNYGPQMQGGHGGGPQRPFFQYSQCTGRRKALLIGINYFNTSSALRGCINDAHNVQKFLIERYRYRPEDIVMLTDDSRNPRQIPNKANMIQAMHWLVQGARPDDALFFHYSGHGGQVKDVSGDEDDGNDECVYPVDFKQAGEIIDDQSKSYIFRRDMSRANTAVHDIMVRPLPPGCRLTAIFDSCHSGTALDLPYVYSTEGKIKEPNLLAEAGQGLLGAGMSYLRGDTGGMLKGVMGIGKSLMGSNSDAAEKTKQTNTSPADVIMWSGCKDSQTSADATEAGKATGAMSYAFIAALTKYPEQSYVQLLNTIRDELKGKYDQKPQLSASHPIDTDLLFIA